jgi:hypothetical protein
MSRMAGPFYPSRNRNDFCSDGVFAEYGGTTWLLSGVWGSGRDNVYVVGANGTILHEP